MSKKLGVIFLGAVHRDYGMKELKKDAGETNKSNVPKREKPTVGDYFGAIAGLYNGIKAAMDLGQDREWHRIVNELRDAQSEDEINRLYNQLVDIYNQVRDVKENPNNLANYVEEDGCVRVGNKCYPVQPPKKPENEDKTLLYVAIGGGVILLMFGMMSMQRRNYY